MESGPRIFRGRIVSLKMTSGSPNGTSGVMRLARVTGLLLWRLEYAHNGYHLFGYVSCNNISGHNYRNSAVPRNVRLAGIQAGNCRPDRGAAEQLFGSTGIYYTSPVRAERSEDCCQVP